MESITKYDTEIMGKLIPNNSLRHDITSISESITDVNKVSSKCKDYFSISNKIFSGIGNITVAGSSR